MHLNEAGDMVQKIWNELPDHYPHVETDEFIVMPDHVHGIIVIDPANVGAGLKPALSEEERAGLKPAPTKRHGLPEIIRAFKTFSSRKINDARDTPGIPLWQRNYYEHIIRDEGELYALREYIRCNPSKWGEDDENPAK
jgi:putative transposase